jgi:putative effector of murein hydrolase
MNEILSQSIFFGIAITLVTYEIGLWIKQKTGKAIANPLLISVILIVVVLLLFHIDYETYANGAQYISSKALFALTVCTLVVW